MSSKQAFKDFKFKSSLLASILTRGLGLMVILVAIYNFTPSWHKPSSMILLPFGLLIAAVGCTLLLRGCDFEIFDGQFRFRRLFTWKSVPLESITVVRPGWIPGMHVRVDYAGKRYRLIVFPEDFKLHLYSPPVIEFLQDVCRKNAENSDPRL